MANDYEVLLEKEAKWAEVDLDALAFNIRQIREKTGPNERLCAVIKANAYGHGALVCAQTLLDNGADQFAVAVLNEAMELREAFPEQDILVLGNIPYGTEEESISAGLQHTVTSVEKARLLSEAAGRLGTTVRIHIKVDSGMTRLGFLPDDEGVQEVIEISKLPNIELEGIFTHFARADEVDKYWADRQYSNYCWFVDQLEQAGISFKLKHVSNSAAIMEMPQTYNDMARPGIILYGIYPSGEVLPENLEIHPVMTWKTRILHVKTLREDRQISYGGKFTAHKGSVIGTLAIGYADGYSRAQSGKAEVLYRGKRVPVVGNICMDQCMIDLSEFPDAKVGDEVILMGRDGDEIITADDLGARFGTIGYEIVCAVNRRVPRYYKKDGELVGRINYLEQH